MKIIFFNVIGLIGPLSIMLSGFHSDMLITVSEAFSNLFDVKSVLLLEKPSLFCYLLKNQAGP